MARPGALATELVDELTKAGADPIFVEIADSYAAVGDQRFKVRRGESDDLAAVTRQLQTRGNAVGGAIYIWNRASDREESAADYRALVSLAESLQLTNDGRDASLDRRNLRDAERHRRTCPGRLAASLALGPVLTLPAETPGLSARACRF